MKRLLCLLISLTLVFSSVSAVIASDKEHWSYESVSELVNMGVVSGDQNGNLNLESFITRAEFVKTINKYFGFIQKAETNFPDISSSAWYYEDMLIAKKAGYILGDENNKANPDAKITRGEVAVIIARILKINDEPKCALADYEEIPSWAKSAVSSLCARGIIKGYEDGSFKSDNSVSRAEAFVVLTRIDRSVASVNKSTDYANDTFIPSGGGSSGGGSSSGGGGGGGGAASVKKPTISVRYFNNNTKDIEFVAENAEVYYVKFVNGDLSETESFSPFKENGTYKYASFSAFTDGLILKFGNNVNVEVYIAAALKKENRDNVKYVKAGTMLIEKNIPPVNDAKIIYSPEKDSYEVSWEATDGADGYRVILFKDRELKEEIFSENISETSYLVDTSAYKNGEVLFASVVAIVDGLAGIPKNSCGCITKGFGGGEGTEAAPYLVYTAGNIENIKGLNGKYFIQMADIGSDNPVTSPITGLNDEFIGNYDGNNKRLYVELTTDEITTDNTKGFGLFPLVKNATFRNIILEGSVHGRGNVGGIAGRGTGKCIFENISNKAAVSSTTGWSGGIIGRMYDENTNGTIIENCTNYAYVKSFGYAGGIAGVSNAMNVIRNCANFGKVESTNTNEGAGYAGGIIATAYGNISGSYNFGEIVANKGNAAGIAGELSKPDYVFENCFNAGKVSALFHKAAIVVSSKEENTPVIKKSYNVLKDLKLYDGSSVPSFIGCVNVNTSESCDGLVIMKPAELISSEISDAYILYEEGKQNEFYNLTYRYPQLRENMIPADYIYDDINLKMSVTDISNDVESGIWYITFNPTIKGNVTKYVLTVTGASDTVITSFNSNNKYEITDIPDGTSTVVLTAYDSEGNIIEISDTVQIDFTFSGGIGTDEKPYIITSTEQFVKAFGNGSSVENGKVFVLTGFDEIPMELPSDFKPLGEAFTGKLIGGNFNDGQLVPVVQKINVDITTGKAVSGVDFYEFVLNNNTYKTQGVLFHQLNGATVKNIAVYGSVNTPNTPSYFGVVSGRAIGGTILENVHNYASVSGDQQRSTGGIVGLTGEKSIVTGCTNHGDITVPHANTARADVGGIIGNMTATTVTFCYNYGNITGRDNAGGITGYSNSDISYCGNYGNISNTRDTTYGYAAGITGRSNGGNISNCFNAGKITSVKYAGSMFAHINKDKTSNVTNCFNLGVIEGRVSTGIVTGINMGTTTISGFYDLSNPGIKTAVGANSGSVTVSDSYSYGDGEIQNDILKVSLDYIRNLAENNEIFMNSEIWNKTENYSYPNLVNNPYNGTDFVTE